MEISEALPHLAGCVDDITLIRSMYGEHFNHEPSLYLMHTGRTLPGRPSLGSWVVYGLGSENQNLPAYVVLDDPKKLPGERHSELAGRIFAAGLSRHALPVRRPAAAEPEAAGGAASAAGGGAARSSAAGSTSRTTPGMPVTRTLTRASPVTNLPPGCRSRRQTPWILSQESEKTREMYGLNDESTASYGRRCLIARRLVERGVRYVQIFIEFQIWDAHSGLEQSLRYSTGKTDKPSAALIKGFEGRGDCSIARW